MKKAFWVVFVIRGSCIRWVEGDCQTRKGTEVKLSFSREFSLVVSTIWDLGETRWAVSPISVSFQHHFIEF